MPKLFTERELECLEALRLAIKKAEHDIRRRKTPKARYRAAVRASRDIYALKEKFFADEGVGMAFIRGKKLTMGEFCPLCRLAKIWDDEGYAGHYCELGSDVLCPLRDDVLSCCREWEDMQEQFYEPKDDKRPFLKAFAKLKKRIDSLDEGRLPEKNEGGTCK